MIILIEGADGTGKSTYAEFVHGVVGGVLLHWGPPDDDPLLMYVARVTRWADEVAVVCDRSSFGSLVWSALGFHRPTMGPEVLAAVCRTYATLGAVGMVLVRPAEDIAATILARGETEVQVGQALAGQDEYIRMMCRHEVLYVPMSLTSSDWAHNERNHHA